MTKEKEFWDWFIENKSGLEKFINSDGNDYTLFNNLTEKVKKYNKDLLPEITINSKNEFVLIITCDGMKAAIPHVITLCDSAPTIPNCVIQKFRQPGYFGKINFGGLSYGPEDIKIKSTPNSGKFDIIIYVKGYTESDHRYGNLAFIYLDHFLGEYNVMTKIGTIALQKLGLFTNKKGLISLDELKKQVVSTLN
jgi:hypothetical protein